jgi:tetratricopeptide (TPR) repeat protein
VTKVRLDSWKAIAEYLERSSRTVQRWHAYHGLPVHHFGGSKGSVFAYAEDIDHWLVGLAEETRIAAGGEDEGLAARKSRSFALTSSADEMWETRSERNLHTIAGFYREAIDEYPANAAAFIGLANTMIFAAAFGIMDPSAAYPRAREALRRMPQLDAASLDAKCAEAWINLMNERKWRQARTGFEVVLCERPRSSFALSGQALLCIAEDNLQEAARYAQEAWTQNRMACSLAALLCWVQYLAGDYEQALELAEEVRTSGGCGATVAAIEALAMIQAGLAARVPHRIEEIAGDFPQSQNLQGVLGYAWAVSGQTDKALEIFRSLEQMSEMKKRNHGYALALVCIGLNRRQEAISWLEAAYAEGALPSLGLRSDPILRPLRGEQRFELLRRKIGSPAGNGIQTGFSSGYAARES